MSAERSFEAWEEMQRHGQDFADRLAQGFTGLLHSHMSSSSFSWPNHQKLLFDYDLSSQIAGKRDFGLAIDNSGVNGVSAIIDIGNRLGQAGAEFGACLNGVVQQFFRRLPSPFRQDESELASLRMDLESRTRNEVFNRRKENFGLMEGQVESEVVSDEFLEEEGFGLNLKSCGHFGKSQGSINITSTYDSRTNDIESSLIARGDLWRAEASHGGTTSGNASSPLFLVQLGPVLFVRDTTLLLPVHLSKQHLLWYGFDRKNGMHSLCPAIWSKHRRWLLMSMICLNPLACSFMDLQFPNGQFTYVSGEGLTTSAFLPVFGGLLQAQGQYPGEMRFSFSCKNKWGTCITPMVQWPDKSFSLGLSQALTWQRSGLMNLRACLDPCKPIAGKQSYRHLNLQVIRLQGNQISRIQTGPNESTWLTCSVFVPLVSICPTFGGSNPRVRAELIHSVKEKLNLICGYVCSAHPSAFASISLGRSKWNGNVGSSGIVINVEVPLSSVGRPSFSVQLNSGVEF